MSVLITILGFLAVAVAGVAGYFIAKKQADNGMLPQYKVWNPYWVPLTVLVDEVSFDLGVVPAATRMAIEFWNGELGFELFRPLGDIGRTGFVSVHHGNTRLAQALLTFDREGMITEAQIVVNPAPFMELSDHDKWVTMAHELGHCLGLDHDDNPGSIMAPHLMVGRPTVLEGDLVLLRKVYRPD